MDLFPSEIEAYAEAHTTAESPLMAQLAEETRNSLQYSVMLSGAVQAQLLKMLVHLTSAQTVLEIGTFTGYSALAMAEALGETGRIITCDTNERYLTIARKYFGLSDHGSKITIEVGPALNTIQHLDGPFDLVYIDADKANYPNYYNAVMPKLRRGGIMVVDNALWSGTVLDPQDDQSKAIHRINEMVANDDGVEHVFLAIRDGFHIVRKL